MRHWVVAVSFALVLPVSMQLRAASPSRQAVAPSAALAANRALLDHYCVTCHNQKAKTANITFDTMDLAHVGKDADVWEKAVRKLRGGMMPPLGHAPPRSGHHPFVRHVSRNVARSGRAGVILILESYRCTD